MKTILRVVLLVPGVLFIVMGVRWVVSPAGMASELGFELANGIGRSSQIGDFAAFFLTAGICILIAVVSRRWIWLYPPALLLLVAAIGRILAWALHDAAFATSMIFFEVGVGTLLLVTSLWNKESKA